MPTKRLQKAVAIFLGLLLAFISLEAAMRATGSISQFRQIDITQRPNLNDPLEYRVVCVGESTTAYVGGKDTTWPRQLERKLQKFYPHLKFKVFNLAYPGASSSFVVSRTIDLLPKLRPHLVISMLGINDVVDLEYLSETGFFSLRIVKLARMIWRNLLVGNNTVDISSLESEVLDRLGSFRENEAVDSSFENQIKNVIKDFPGNEWLVYHVASGVAREQTLKNAMIKNNSVRKIKMGFEVSYRLGVVAFDLNSTESSILVRLIYLLDDLQGEHFAETMNRVKVAFEKGIHPEPDLVTQLLRVAPSLSEEVINYLAAYGAVIRHRKQPYLRTISNYRKLADTLSSSGINYIAMQYPTGSIHGLINIFSSRPETSFGAFSQTLYLKSHNELDPRYSSVIFVDNSNFNQIAMGSKKYTYFRDMFTASFGGRFGHTTSRGDELIANNLMKKINQTWSILNVTSDKVIGL